MSVNEEQPVEAAEEVQKKETLDQPPLEVTEESEKQAKTSDKIESQISPDFITGEVALWKKTHGFLRYKDGDEMKRVFVHKSNVKTDDKRVLLRRGIQLKFKLESLSNDKTNALEVQGLNGEPLNFHQKHGESDTYDREILYEDTFFQGEIKFFSRLRGYGRILMNDESIEKLKGFKVSEEELTAVKDLYFKEIDLDVADYPAKLDRADKVSFQIFNSSRGYGGMHIRTESGEPIPKFTKEDREAKRAKRKAEIEIAKGKAAEKKAAEEAKKEKSEKKENKRKNKRRERRDRKKEMEKKSEKKEDKKAEVKPKRKKEFQAIDEEARFEGIVNSFSVHRFGFIKMETNEAFDEISKFGFLKNKKLCFRVQDIETEQRPPMIDLQAKVKFSINRMESGVLYATNIRDENDNPIVSEKKYEAPEPRTLLNPEEWCEGEVRFYNWRRGHGRITLKDGDDFYFHRDDIKSNDKVPGVEAETKVMCQKVDDPKGPAVTNVCNTDKTSFEGQLPPFLKPKKEEEN